VAVGELVCTLHAEVSCTAFGLCFLENFAEDYTCEEGGGDASSTPRETFGLANDVLFFSSVASTHKGDRVCDVVVLLHQVTKCESDWVLDHTLDGELPVGYLFVFDLRDMAMIPDVEEFRTCEEAFIVEI
jgi:hypothetical protein